MTMRSGLLWILSFIITAGLAIYQRKTGPTQPIKGDLTFENQYIRYKLLRTAEVGNDADIRIVVADTNIKGELLYRRFKSRDRWAMKPLERHGDTLIAYIPQQIAAGKVMYQITLCKGDRRTLLNSEPAIIRFKGTVPGGILWLHILTIFLAMLLSTRTGLEAIFKGNSVHLCTWITVIFLFLGGLVFGPLVQKSAFDAYWTGWPFGHDLTDNKILIAFIFWMIALIVQIKNRANRIWPVVASVLLLVVFLIPHSVLGSEVDFTKEPNIQNITD